MSCVPFTTTRGRAVLLEQLQVQLAEKEGAPFLRLGRAALSGRRGGRAGCGITGRRAITGVARAAAGRRVRGRFGILQVGARGERRT